MDFIKLFVEVAPSDSRVICCASFNPGVAYLILPVVDTGELGVVTVAAAVPAEVPHLWTRKKTATYRLQCIDKVDLRVHL